MSDAPRREDLRSRLPDVLATIENMELRARHIVEGYVTGMHRSPSHGFSQEFAEHREYAPGDDLRYVDWKVFGRTDKHYVKRFEEETNLTAHFLLDVSRSMEYTGPSGAMSKREYAMTATAALAYLVLRQQDNAMLATFADDIVSLTPPRSGGSHLSHLLDAMLTAQGKDATDAGAVFHNLAERFRKRGIVVILSDCLGDSAADTDRLLSGMRHFTHRRHEVILLHVLDPAEIDFPFTGNTRFVAMEGDARIVAAPRAIRKAYRKRFEEFRLRLESGCRAAGIEYVLMRTDHAVDTALANYLALRRRYRGDIRGGGYQ